MSTDPALTIAVIVLAAICGGVGLLVVTLLRARRRDAQIFDLLATFGPVAERARSDPRVLLAWYPTAEAARRTFPDAFAAIGQNGTNRFPFGAAQLEAATPGGPPIGWSGSGTTTRSTDRRARRSRSNSIGPPASRLRPPGHVSKPWSGRSSHGISDATRSMFRPRGRWRT